MSGLRRIEPGCGDDAARRAERQQHRRPGMLLEERQQFVIDVADHVSKHVDACPQQVLGFAQSGCMHRHAQSMFVGLVEDRAVQVGRQRLDRAASGVHPRLDQRDLEPRQFLHVGTGALDCGHHVRGVAHVLVADFFEWRQASAGSQKSRRIGMLASACLVPDLKRQLAEVAAHRLAGRHAEIREPIQVVEDVLARVILRPAREVLHVADVRMRIDQGGDDGLAGEVHPTHIGASQVFALATHTDETTGLNQERGSLDRRGPVSRDESCSLIQNSGCGSRGLGGADEDRCRDETGQQKSHGQAFVILRQSSET